MTDISRIQLSLHELSKATGRCPNTIRKLVELGLPTYKLGRSRDVLVGEYEEFIRKHFGPDGDMRGQIDLDIKIEK